MQVTVKCFGVYSDETYIVEAYQQHTDVIMLKRLHVVQLSLRTSLCVYVVCVCVLMNDRGIC